MLPCIMPDFIEDVFWDYTFWRDFYNFWTIVYDYTYDEYGESIKKEYIQ